MSIRVLLVDDHDMVREALCAVLEDQSSIEVIGQASCCAEALATLTKLQPDVLVLDYSLSDGSALTVIPEVRTKHPSVRILVLTVHDNVHYATRCIQAGAHGYLPKSGPVADLATAIQRVHAGELVIPGRHAAGVFDTIRAGSGVESLSPREFELLRLLGSGATLTDAARQQNISTSTASTYRTRLMEKLGLKTTAEVIRYALENDLV